MPSALPQLISQRTDSLRLPKKTDERTWSSSFVGFYFQLNMCCICVHSVGAPYGHIIGAFQALQKWLIDCCHQKGLKIMSPG